MCKRNGNPKRASKFICLKCGKIVMDGLQRTKQRPFLHIKDLYCVYCKAECKAVEIRYLDDIHVVMEAIPNLKEKYYKECEVV